MSSIGICDVLRAMETHLMQTLAQSEAAVARIREALAAVQEAKRREGCDDAGGYLPNDQQPTVDGIDTDLDMGEPSDAPKAYEPPKE